MTDTIYLGQGQDTGDATTPATAMPRWSSADLVILDQKIIDDRGSSETLFAIRNTDAGDDNMPAPRVRVGLYVSEESGILKYNTSIRAITHQKHVDGNGAETFKEVSFVLAGTTYHTPQPRRLKDFVALAWSLLVWDLSTDTTTNRLINALEDFITTPANIGEPYTGSTVV